MIYAKLRNVILIREIFLSNYLNKIFNFSTQKSALEAIIFYVVCNLCVIFCAFLGGLSIVINNIDYLTPNEEVLNSFFCLFLSIFILYKKGQTRQYMYVMISFLSFLVGYLGTSFLGLLFTSYLTIIPSVNFTEDDSLEGFNKKYWYGGFAIQNINLVLIYKIFLTGWGYAILFYALGDGLNGLVQITAELLGNMLVPLTASLILALVISVLYYLFQRKWNNYFFFWTFNLSSLVAWLILFIPLLV